MLVSRVSEEDHSQTQLTAKHAQIRSLFQKQIFQGLFPLGKSLQWNSGYGSVGGEYLLAWSSRFDSQIFTPGVVARAFNSSIQEEGDQPQLQKNLLQGKRWVGAL